MNRMKRNISISEIEKFNEFSIDWWDETGRMKSLHDINPLRLSYIIQKTSLKGKRVLDVGCGGGILTEKIAQQGAITFGIDASAHMTAIARSHAQKADLDIEYIDTDIEHITQFTNTGFDVILCMELLEHVPCYKSIILACRKILNPGGIIIFSTINRNLLSFLLAILIAEYILELLPKGTHEYKSLIKPHELNRVCSGAGLKNFDITGFSYNPFTRNYYFCKNSMVNYMASFKHV
ncbi:MAG: bifunctional 2-polyprenyl-6-hydroxyphenol methylase/3-demethylubiquinol 3-O-methyltransferase UbiG [Deltaproteobacteria bacterium]|jgi:2-polyprenyl-6-hydroxyphenyl methylase/3-demethylubiquinone-9 3-methyltransferase|nr:bifunctional 2-polyprenyl-6-hydroxyphenol methylase/3-demethylubiquinol 3-O-methyltransferase UbiG [Deltaproteobacteria bacterium]